MQQDEQKHKWNIFFLIAIFAICMLSCGDDKQNADMDDGDSDSDGETKESNLEPVPEGKQIPITIDTEKSIATVSDNFISFALDTSQVVGGYWWSDADKGGSKGSERTDPFDFSRSRLRLLTKALAPAYLRVGGSEADVVQYDLSDNPPKDATEPFLFVFTKKQFDDLNNFAIDMGLDVFFTLNAGPGCRKTDKSWDAECVREWMKYAKSQNYPVKVWELGNEINGYMLFHGFDWEISGEIFAADVANLKKLRDEIDPETPIAGPSSAFWPEFGEMSPIYPDFMQKGGGKHLDIITWHYYPQQSDRCPVKSLLAEPYTMLETKNLDEINKWADEVENLRDEYASNAEVWLGESGNAQCGGQIGVSDRFVSGFWWLDELGTLAKRGQKVVVRQTLSGSDYGMIHNGTLEPNPDYWLSLLWKKSMGTKVLSASVAEKNIRVYAHCMANDYKKGGVSVLMLNIDRDNSYMLTLPKMPANSMAYEITADELLGKEIKLNGKKLEITDEKLPEIKAVTLNHGDPSWYKIKAASMVFLLFPEADAEACK